MKMNPYLGLLSSIITFFPQTSAYSHLHKRKCFTFVSKKNANNFYFISCSFRFNTFFLLFSSLVHSLELKLNPRLTVLLLFHLFSKAYLRAFSLFIIFSFSFFFWLSTCVHVEVMKNWDRYLTISSYKMYSWYIYHQFSHVLFVSFLCHFTIIMFWCGFSSPQNSFLTTFRKKALLAMR